MMAKGTDVDMTLLSRAPSSYERGLPLLLIVGLVLYWFYFIVQGKLLLSPDSTFYLKYSQDIFNHFDFSNIKTVWPPMYPVMIAAGQLFTVSELNAVMIVTGASLALTLFVFFNIMRLARFPLSIALSAVVILFFNDAFLYLFLYAWSEAPFTAFFLVIVYCLAKHHQTHQNVYLYCGLVFVSIIALTRYLGYYALALAGIYLVIYLWQNRLFRTLEAHRVLVLLGLSAIPSVLWILRNYRLDGTLHGPRESSSYSVSGSIEAAFSTLVTDNQWVLIGAVIAGFFVWFLARRAEPSGSENITGDARNLRNFMCRILWLFGLGFLLYVLLVIYSASIAQFDPIGTRFFAPVYPFFVFALGAVLTLLHNGLVTDKQRKFFQFTLAMMVLLYVVSAFLDGAGLYTGHFEVANTVFWNGYVISY